MSEGRRAAQEAQGGDLEAGRGGRPAEFARELCHDMYNPGVPLPQLESLSTSTYGKTYSQLDASEREIIALKVEDAGRGVGREEGGSGSGSGERARSAAGGLPAMQLSPSNTDDMRHHEKGYEKVHLPKMDE